MADTIENIRKKYFEIHETLSTAYHECGHAVYGLLHFMMVEGIVLFEDKKTKRIFGYTDYSSKILSSIESEELLNDRLHAEIGVLYAGLVVDKIFFKQISGSDKYPMFLKEGASNDISVASGLFIKYNLMMPGKERYRHKQKIIKNVKHDLLLYWDDVMLLSHAVFKKKKLNYSEIYNILCVKSNNKKFWKEQYKKINKLYNSSKEDDILNIVNA